MREHVLIYVNCLYGVGHYRRVELLARALQRHSPDRPITIFTGGPPWPPFSQLPLCQVVPLPGLRYQSIETPDLIGLDGRPAETVLCERRRIIEETLASARVTTVLFEFFPFSSQFLSDEARALVAAVRANCRTARCFSCVRDIVWNRRMAASPQQWKATAEALTEELIDWILVHSDPTFLPFEFCWGSAPSFAAKVVHTGILTERLLPLPPPPLSPSEAPVVCSVGGGRDGLPALRLFLEAWDLLRRSNRLPRHAHGQVFAGLFQERSAGEALLREYEHLFTPASGGLQMGSWETYAEVARRASVSVSMCGYNTCYEVLSWGVPAIFLPRNYQEQTTRAGLIEQRGWAQVALDAQQLSEALLRAWHGDSAIRSVPPLDFNGAAQAARLLGELGGDGG